MSLKLFTLCALLVAFVDAIRINPLEYEDYYAPYAPAPPQLGNHDYSMFAKAVQKKKKSEEQDLSKVAGVPGHDYPIFHEFPHTSFDCAHVPHHPGFYANVETGCQGYHVCNDGREGSQGSKFLCTNGTLFSQKDFTCDHWFNVDCNEATHYYSLNSDPDTNPYTKDDKKKAAEAAALAEFKSHHAPQYSGGDYY